MEALVTKNTFSLTVVLCTIMVGKIYGFVSTNVTDITGTNHTGNSKIFFLFSYEGMQVGSVSVTFQLMADL